MLLSITNKCRMGCPHCMDDALPTGNQFMDLQTFMDALDFNFKYDFNIIVTGGEPTEHPSFWMYMSIMTSRLKAGSSCVITTNGMNMDKDTGSIYDGMLKLNEMSNGAITYQVTSNPDLYPTQIDLSNKIFSLPFVVVDREIVGMYPQGRALKNGFEPKLTKAPKCFNIRSAIITKGNIGESVFALRMLGKFCTPQIAPDGSIKLGESCLCPSVASIYDTEEQIVDKIKRFRCKGCKVALDMLPDFYKQVIGEC